MIGFENPGLIELLERIKESALEEIDDTKRYHYIKHCIALQKDIIECDIRISYLSKYELFVLLCSIWWHDLGNYCTPIGSEKAHNDISAEKLNNFIINNQNRLDASVISLLEIASNICKAHTDHISRDLPMIHTNTLRDQVEVGFIPRISIREKYIGSLLRFVALLEIDVRFDWPQWIMDVMRRCWPRDYRANKYDYTPPHSRIGAINSDETYVDLILHAICPRISDDTKEPMVFCELNDNEEPDICRFLFLAHYYQIKIELDNCSEIVRFKSVELHSTEFLEKKIEKYRPICEAFTDKNKLEKIYNYCCVGLSGKNGERIKDDNAKKFKLLGDETLHEVLSGISGNYLLDTIFNNKLEQNDYTGLMIDDICHKSRWVGIKMSDTDNSSISIEYHYSDKGIVDETKSISKPKMLYIALFLALKYWCNTQNYEKLEYLQNVLDKRKDDNDVFGEM